MKRIGEIGNHYGGLWIKSEEDKYFWSIEDYGGHGWVEIPKHLYNHLDEYENYRLRNLKAYEEIKALAMAKSGFIKHDAFSDVDTWENERILLRLWEEGLLVKVTSHPNGTKPYLEGWAEDMVVMINGEPQYLEIGYIRTEEKVTGFDYGAKKMFPDEREIWYPGMLRDGGTRIPVSMKPELTMPFVRMLTEGEVFEKREQCLEYCNYMNRKNKREIVS